MNILCTRGGEFPKEQRQDNIEKWGIANRGYMTAIWKCMAKEEKKRDKSRLNKQRDIEVKKFRGKTAHGDERVLGLTIGISMSY